MTTRSRNALVLTAFVALALIGALALERLKPAARSTAQSQPQPSSSVAALPAKARWVLPPGLLATIGVRLSAAREGGWLAASGFEQIGRGLSSFAAGCASSPLALASTAYLVVPTDDSTEPSDKDAFVVVLDGIAGETLGTCLRERAAKAGKDLQVTSQGLWTRIQEGEHDFWLSADAAIFGPRRWTRLMIAQDSAASTATPPFLATSQVARLLFSPTERQRVQMAIDAADPKMAELTQLDVGLREDAEQASLIASLSCASDAACATFREGIQRGLVSLEREVPAENFDTLRAVLRDARWTQAPGRLAAEVHSDTMRLRTALAEMMRLRRAARFMDSLSD